MIPYEVIKEFILSGVKYKYLSYDHNAAVAEMKQSKIIPNSMFLNSSWDIPKNIKQKHAVWRTGKLRQVLFAPDGRMWKFYIGARRAKSFSISDFGVGVKPIIFKSDDMHDLINRGFAIEDKL